MSHQFEDAEDLGHPDETDDLAGLADDVELAEMVHDEVDEVGKNGEQIDQVHWLNEELNFLRRARQPDKVLDGEVDGREVVHVEDGGGNRAVLIASVVHDV